MSYLNTQIMQVHVTVEISYAIIKCSEPVQQQFDKPELQLGNNLKILHKLLIILSFLLACVLSHVYYM